MRLTASQRTATHQESPDRACRSTDIEVLIKVYAGSGFSFGTMQRIHGRVQGMDL